MKPRDTSDEGHDPLSEVRGEPGNWAVAPVLPHSSSVRNASGVVAAPGPQISAAEEDDDATTVGPGTHPLPEDQQAALSRRIRTALGQTLPLGTPAPGAPAARGPRSAFSRTMLLGGRQLPGILSESSLPAGRARSSVPPSSVPSDAAPRSESVTPSVSSAAPPFARPRPAERPMSDREALRASFVRPVGLPTAPPPRRSRRPNSLEEDSVESEAPVSESEHEAFALERPLTTPGLPALGRSYNESLASSGSATAGAASARSEPASRGGLPMGLMLPPPPQPIDYEPASSPSSLPPAPRLALPAAPVTIFTAPAPPRAPAPVLLTDLPSANPFEGFEAPRETLVQRSLIVFVVALAVVGLFALAAVAFGFVGKTGW